MRKGKSRFHSSDSDGDNEKSSGRKGNENMSIEERIMNAQHPLEKTGFFDSRTMTPSQRAIICCIQMNNGCASENDILYFVQSNWDFIGKMNARIPSSMPDSRIIHINLAIKKKGIPLFVPKEDDPTMYLFNTNTNINTQSKPKTVIMETRQTRSSMKTNSENEGESQATKNESNEETSQKEAQQEHFEDLESVILSILHTSSESLTLDEIVAAAEKYRELPGLYSLLPFRRRVNAILVSFRSKGKAFCHEGQWSRAVSKLAKQGISRKYGTKREAALIELKGVENISVDELWKTLKAKNVF